MIARTVSPKVLDRCRVEQCASLILPKSLTRPFLRFTVSVIATMLGRKVKYTATPKFQPGSKPGRVPHYYEDDDRPNSTVQVYSNKM